MPAAETTLDEACALVGQYQYHFSKIEAALNEGIAKALQLNDGAAAILGAAIDFSRKVRILKAIVKQQFKDEDGTIDKLLNRIFGINDPERQNVIHATFEPAADGVRFNRLMINRKGLERANYEWSREEFKGRFANMQNAATKLQQLVRELKPYTPSFDFSDPRNSMYLTLL
jgi:hypothetical protein